MTGTSAPLAPAAGIGLRAPHYRDLLESRPALAFVEVHSENFFSPGGVPAHFLERARALYPVSLHGVGLSLGSTDPLNLSHLRQLRALVARIEPALVSDHLCWSSVGGRYFNDLLPLPYTQEALDHLVHRVGQVQDALGRQILVENLSSYVSFDDSELAEAQFLAELARRSGCGLLLDVNNIFVSSRNHGFDARAYLRAIPPRFVQEIHLAGHTAATVDGVPVLIDTHDQRVVPDVWRLYAETLSTIGPRPTLIEWDSDLPDFAVLLDEARLADAHLASAGSRLRIPRHGVPELAHARAA